MTMTALVPTAILLSVGHLEFTPDGRFEIFRSLGSVYRAPVAAPLGSRGYRERAEFVALWSSFAPDGTLGSGRGRSVNDHGSARLIREMQEARIP